MNDNSTVTTSPLVAAVAWMILLAGLLATVFVYWPGLQGPLVFDDVSTISGNKAPSLSSLDFSSMKRAAFSSQGGEVNEWPLVRLSYALDQYYTGGSVFSSRIVNLVLHLLNGVLVFLLLKLLVRFDTSAGESSAVSSVSAVIIALISVGWLLHPLNLTSVLYLAERGTLLSTLFALLAFIAYTYGRVLWGEGSRWQAVTWIVGGLLAALAAGLSGEAVLILPMALFLLEWLIPLNRKSNSLVAGLSSLSALFWLVVSLLAIGMYSYWAADGSGFDALEISPWNVLLTDARVVVFYLGLLVLPRPSELGLFHDDILYSTGLFSPLTTLFAVMTLVLLVLAAVMAHRKHPLMTFGLLVFLAAHFVGAWLFPNGMVQEYRNYLPSIGILLAVAAGFVSSKRLTLSSEIRVLVVVVFCVFFGAVTYGRGLAWQSENRLAMTLLHNHPDSARSNYEAATIYVDLSADPLVAVPDRDLFRQKAVDQYQSVARLQPDDAGALLAVLLMEGVEKQGNKEFFLSNLLEGGGNNKAIPLEIDQNLLADLPRRLGVGKPSRLELGNLIQISRCERSGRCYFNPGQVDMLFNSLLENPRATQKTHDMAAFLDEAAARELGRGNLSQARKLMGRALSIEPRNPMFRLNEAAMLYSDGMRDKALAQVKAVLKEAQTDHVVAYAKQLLSDFGSSTVSKSVAEPQGTSD